ncbi:MAG TPA: hypothetical protein VHZ28_00825 [Terracidiphilus sp.]|jgi:hypothetical protein|nr:hypothetical protein [Terracidiphilus sp.]
MDPSFYWIANFVLSVAGASIGTYFTARAKNLATHDDLDKLVEQVQAVTHATEAIKAEISSGLWDRQKRWEVRRDIVLDFMRSAGRVDAALRDFVSSCQIRPTEPEKLSVWLPIHTAASRKWLDISSECEGAIGLLDIVSGQELRAASAAWIALRVNIRAKASAGDIGHYNASFQNLKQSSRLLQTMIRKELGIEEPFVSLSGDDGQAGIAL